MTISTATRTKCAKPAGAYCRLHNPEPKTRKFQNLDEVFQAVEDKQEKNTNSAIIPFQGIKEKRRLKTSCPPKLKDQVKKSQEMLLMMSLTEQKALLGYTGHFGTLCNAALSGRTVSYSSTAPKWEEAGPDNRFLPNEQNLITLMETMDKVLETRQDNQRILYRGVPIYKTLHAELENKLGKKLKPRDYEGLAEGLKLHYKTGDLLNFPEYLSTSTSAYPAIERAQDPKHTVDTSYYSSSRGIVFEIKTNAGVDISGLSKYTEERETLLPRDTYFKIVNVHIQPSQYTIDGVPDHFETKYETYNDLAAVIQMVEVDKNGNEIVGAASRIPSQSVKDSLKGQQQ